MIDLSTALPITTLYLQQALRNGLSALGADADFSSRIRANRPFGSERDRLSGAKWLSQRFGTDLRANGVFLTNGTQSSLLWILQLETKPGDTVLAERLAYVRFKPLATSLGLNVAGIDMDEEGIVPAALEAACRQFRPKALFCTPTLQNPTLAVMSPQRRKEIARIAEAYDLLLVEDDVLGMLHPNAPAPLYRFASNRTYYVMSLSKCLAMGLRLAYVVLPAYRNADDPGELFSRASWIFPNSLSCELIHHWIETRTINEIVQHARADIQTRQKLALEILEQFGLRSVDGALHVWMTVAANYAAESISKEAFDRGVAIRAAGLFRVDDQPLPNALRIAITAPETHEELISGLEVVADLLSSQAKARP